MLFSLLKCLLIRTSCVFCTRAKSSRSRRWSRPRSGSRHGGRRPHQIRPQFLAESLGSGLQVSLFTYFRWVIYTAHVYSFFESGDLLLVVSYRYWYDSKCFFCKQMSKKSLNFSSVNPQIALLFDCVPSSNLTVVVLKTERDSGVSTQVSCQDCLYYFLASG